MRWRHPVLYHRVEAVSTPAVARGNAGCLHSWKEIAAYLDRGVRTVQRWEHTEGLPVHRHAHAKRDSVYAYVEELDAWWANDRASVQNSISGPAALVRVAKPHRRWGVYAAVLFAVLLAAGAFWIFVAISASPA